MDQGSEAPPAEDARDRDPEGESEALRDRGTALDPVQASLGRLEIPHSSHNVLNTTADQEQQNPSGGASPRPNGNHADGSEEAGPSGRGSVEDVGIGASRRNTSIRPKDCAGSLIWAKLAKYPWWPAQILDPKDPWIPSSNEKPRRGAIPVRFFGTYDFAWIENQRAICSYSQHRAEHSLDPEQGLAEAVVEADHFEATQELPNGFNEETTPSPQKAPRKVKAGKGKGKKGEQAVAAGKGKKRGAQEEAVVAQKSVKERQEAILQALALAPPPESPFSHQPCLKGVRKLLEMQKAGLWPAPAPKPQPLLQQPFLQFHSTQMSQPQQAPTVLASQFPYQQQGGAHVQHPQYQPQLPHHHPGQPAQTPWYIQPGFAGQAHGLHFFGQHGGVPGALLAAASQQQYNMGHHFPPVEATKQQKQ